MRITLVMGVLLVSRVALADSDCLLLRTPSENSTAFVIVDFADENNEPISPAEATRTVFDANGDTLDGPVTVTSPGASFSFTVPWEKNPTRGENRVVQASWKWGPGNIYQNVLRCAYVVQPVP